VHPIDFIKSADADLAIILICEPTASDMKHSNKQQETTITGIWEIQWEIPLGMMSRNYFAQNFLIPAPHE
jgi:hypothetical protein